MSVRALSVFAALASLCAACPGVRTPEVAELIGSSPGQVEQGLSVELTITGSGFAARVGADLDDPSASTLSGYRVLLESASGESSSFDGELVSSTLVRATLPASVPVGRYVLRLEDGWGRSVKGEGALEVAAPACSSPNPCDDGIRCTTDSCVSGACRHEAVSCDRPPSACHEAQGVCDERSGQCLYATRAPDSPCDDGISCSAGERCTSQGVCAGSVWSCTAIAPRACLVASPTAASPGVPVTFDAACSVDLDGPAAALTARFDFEGDGTFDTAFGPLNATHVFSTGGFYSPQVELRDGTDRRAVAVTAVAVADTSLEVVVTTAADEADPSASPGAPGGSGLSLREAITHVNGLNRPALITFAAPYAITARTLPGLTPPRAAIWGQPGVSVNFQGTTVADGPCLTLDGDEQRLAHVELKGCGGEAVEAGGSDCVIAFNVFTGSPTSAHSARFSKRGTFGPQNLVRGFTVDSAMQVKVDDVVITGNTFENNQSALEVKSGHSRTKILSNAFIDHSSDVILLSQGNHLTEVSHNTFVRAPDAVSSISSTDTEVAAHNNLFHHVRCAYVGAREVFSPMGAMLLSPVTASTCLESSADGGVIIAADPQLISVDGGDLRLIPGSAAIDVGTDTGRDLNGALPGNFHGSAPDLGACEATH